MTKLRAFTMPKWGIEMTEGVIAEWKVEEGAPFKKGDLIALIETDKITNEVEAEFDGKFPRLIAQSGETYPVGELLAIASGAEDSPDAGEIEAFIDSFKPAEGSAASKGGKVKRAANGKAAPAPTGPKAASAKKMHIAKEANISPAARDLAEERGVDIASLSGSGKGGRITYQDVLQASLPEVAVGGDVPVDITPVGNRLDDYYASPLAKRLAVQFNVDLSKVSGTGPRGRICKTDVLAQAEARASAPDKVPAMTFERPADGMAEIVKMSPMRKAIARSLSYSKSTIPHYYLRSRVRIDGLLALRAQAKAATGEAPSLNDYIVRACAIALTRHRDVNIQVHGDEIHRFGHADISVAVATDKGLITPIVRKADQLSVAAISQEVKRLAALARDGKLQPQDYQGGSFTVSNLGMYGIDQFDAIINPPQGAILAVGAGTRQPVEIGNALAFATIVELSLSSDHRAIDGAVGAQFLKSLKELIEDPSLLTA